MDSAGDRDGGCSEHGSPAVNPCTQASRVRYVGRAASASTATGDKYEHLAEHKALLEAAFA